MKHLEFNNVKNSYWLTCDSIYYSIDITYNLYSDPNVTIWDGELSKFITYTLGVPRSKPQALKILKDYIRSKYATKSD